MAVYKQVKEREKDRETHIKKVTPPALRHSLTEAIGVDNPSFAWVYLQVLAKEGTPRMTSEELWERRQNIRRRRRRLAARAARHALVVSGVCARDGSAATDCHPPAAQGGSLASEATTLTSVLGMTARPGPLGLGNESELDDEQILIDAVAEKYCPGIHTLHGAAARWQGACHSSPSPHGRQMPLATIAVAHRLP